MKNFVSIACDSYVLFICKDTEHCVTFQQLSFDSSRKNLQHLKRRLQSFTYDSTSQKRKQATFSILTCMFLAYNTVLPIYRDGFLNKLSNHDQMR